MAKGSGGTRGAAGGGSVRRDVTEVGQNASLSMALLKHEKVIQGSGVENAAIFDENGNLLYKHTDNAKDWVKFDGKLATNNVMTHNHTNNTSFSPTDVVNVVKTNGKETRVTTPTRTYSLKRPAKGWGVSAKVVESTLMDKAFGLKLKMNRYVARYKGDKKVAEGRAKRLFTHILTKQVAKEFGWSYTSRKS
jgi:hypothetical protein